MRLPSMFLCGTLLLLSPLGPVPACAQSQAPAATPQSTATTTPPPAAQEQATPLPNAKPVKVWTDDEVRTLRNDNGISVVGKVAPQKVSAASKASSQEKDPAWYRKQLAPLREEIDKLDPQIAKLQAYLSGENVGEQASLHPKMVPTPQEQLKQMEAKRQADAAKMEDLLDRARHEGIEPGALR